jgi:hypothetical protein
MPPKKKQKMKREFGNHKLAKALSKKKGKA